MNLYQEIIDMMEERDMFHCCDYWDRSGFEDDLEMIIMKYENEEKE